MMMRSPRPRILFLSQCLPYPPQSGPTSRTFNVLMQLQKEFDIRLLAFSRLDHQPDLAARESSRQALGRVIPKVCTPIPIPCEHSRIRRLWDHLRSWGSGRAFMFFEYSSIDFHLCLQNELSEMQPDLIHIDSLDLYRWLGGTCLKTFGRECTRENIPRACG